jgi:type II secretory pathway component PulC
MNLSKLIWFVNLLLAAAVVWVTVNMVLTWKQRRADPGLTAQKVVEPGTPKPVVRRELKPLEAFQPIMDLNVFKTTPSRPEKKAGLEPEEIKITALDLKLMGTIVRDKGPSFAIIQEGKTRKQELYYLKDFVQGAQIAKILPDRVILSLNGKEEALVMSDETEPPAGRPGQVTRLPERTTTPQRVIRRPTPTVRRPMVTRQTQPVTPPAPRVIPPQETPEEEPEKDSDQVESSEDTAEKRPPQMIRGRTVEKPAEEKEQ